MVNSFNNFKIQSCGNKGVEVEILKGQCYLDNYLFFVTSVQEGRQKF